MRLLQILREARRRRAVQRALERGERLGGLGLVGKGFDAVLMQTPGALQNVDPIDRLLRYINAAAEIPSGMSGAKVHVRREIGAMIQSAWRARSYPHFARAFGPRPPSAGGLR